MALNNVMKYTNKQPNHGALFQPNIFFYFFFKYCIHCLLPNNHLHARELTFQSFAKLELPLFRGLILHCLLYCYAREGGWESFKPFSISNMATVHKYFHSTTYQTSSCTSVCMSVSYQCPLDTSCDI